jgi:hypothetical protein
MRGVANARFQSDLGQIEDEPVRNPLHLPETKTRSPGLFDADQPKKRLSDKRI